ncbi:Zn(II)2Cys6 transcription factor [Aspergillus brunneoviolaceus CBS 621.78]|uniref:Uncharacterized protein n=1 Tax=Aspergillus brunneoviolaceus CBS 621.78 TaxID=1450534 RepID=A0ACD1FUJ1_9EURO|nr:hypothetical protein BO95DRAFT_477102 [Aspergillus brunneoviolaceus CBS 621.78]RAH40590.1 hypothetical protein BO95DRAFT_477102 [Aspergillus brunneoviolaceus CBS 621.78]
MESLMAPFQTGNLKRIRQACANCRRRKTKCSGERPICFHCRRNKHSCIYEPYSVTIGDNPPSTPPAQTSENTQLLQRISLIESRLAELSGQAAQQPRSPSIDAEPLRQQILSTQPPVSGIPFVTPSQPVLDSIMDTYFLHVHNQPYSNFQEISFRQELRNGTLPRCLILAMLASAVRFSTHELYAERALETSEVYAREAWLSVLTDYLTVEDDIGLTKNLAGRVNSGWLKIGLAARIAQGLGLMGEPDAWLPAAEQEERRRAFWSVQLPCDEVTLRLGEIKKTYTLNQLLNWNTEIAESPSPFALVILLASIFGRCTRYVYANRHIDEIPPWDTESEYTAINSSLLLFESYAKSGDASVVDMARQSAKATGTPNHQELGHQTFAHTLFHLCQCLLNHPFPFGSKAPHSFVTRALQNGIDHATQLVRLLRDVSEAGGLVESSFYAYSHQKLPCRSSDMLECFQHALDILDRLAQVWTHAANMAIRLRDFHAQRRGTSSVLDESTPPSDLDPRSDEALWAMLDYSILGSNLPKTSSESGSDYRGNLSPTPWALGSNMPISTSSSRIDLGDDDLFRGLSPALRLNEVEFLLNCSTPRTGCI